MVHSDGARGQSYIHMKWLPPHAQTSAQGHHLTSGFLFAVLLNFKHIYMYIAVSFLGI
jgi:hypothetical protein